MIVELLFKLRARVHRLADVVLSRVYSLRFRSCGPNAMFRSPKTILGAKYVQIGSNFDCFPGLRLEVFDRHLSRTFQPRLLIGDGVSINYDCHIGCVNAIEIGDNVLIASRVYITDHVHGASDYSDILVPPSQRLVTSKGPVVIEPDAWIGEGACILPGVRIGRGAIIGANAVVTRDVPPYTVAAGIPARVLKNTR